VPEPFSCPLAADDPYTTITEPTFVARFLLDSGTDTLDTVANVDAFVDLPDGSTWALTMFTVDEVIRLLARCGKKPPRSRTAVTSGPSTS